MNKKVWFAVAPLALVAAFSVGKLTQSKPDVKSVAKPEVGASTTPAVQDTPVDQAGYLIGSDWLVTQVQPLLIDGIEKGRIFTLGDSDRRTHVLTVYPRHQNYDDYLSLHQDSHIKLMQVETLPSVPQDDPNPLNRSDYLWPQPVR